MSASIASVFHDSICGGLAAAGFGVLFNVGFRTLPLCAASGALALAVRTAALGLGWGLEGSSFAAALALGFAIQLFPSSVGVSRNVLHVVGCIPMIPGAFAAKAILGLFAITQSSSVTNDTLLSAIAASIHVMFTIGALGTGLAIPSLIFRKRQAA
jgi:uncharacterized membrane protein YjjB (DUF3815 family)